MMIWFILAIACFLGIPAVAHSFVFVPNPTRRPPSRNRASVMLVVLGLMVMLILGLVVFNFSRDNHEAGTPQKSTPFIAISFVILGLLLAIACAYRMKRQNTEDATGGSIPEQIEQLAKLKDQGILSEREFEQKKRDLLSRM